jgi:hypothetical protein
MSGLISKITRSVVRPIITLGLLGVWVWFIAAGLAYPNEFKLLVLAVTLEWFGERAISRFLGKQ